MKTLLVFVMVLSAISSFSQTGAGIGFYPTGSEAGIGFRSGKNSTTCLDARISKVLFTPRAGTSSLVSELNAIFRVVKLEKVRFHIGVGARSEWNIDRPNKYGAVIPLGVEGFPFPFQNAGVFFEVAPYFSHDLVKDYNAGLRTVAGFVFYFLTKQKTETTK